MSIAKAYAVVSTADLVRAREWYSRLFGRAPDLTPMAEVHEWYFREGGVQVVDDPSRAGRSMLTLIVTDLAGARTDLQSRNLALGPQSGGEFAMIARISDPDGNQITFAQPGPAQDFGPRR